MAGEQGREVFAVPGHPLDPRAEGTNGLIKSGATMVTEPEAVVAALSPMLREAAALPFEAPPRNVPAPPRWAPLDAQADREASGAVRDRVLEALGPAPVDIDELSRATSLSPQAVQIALLELALAGRVERHGRHLVSLKG